MNASFETTASDAALARLKQRAAAWSVAATIVVTALKLVAALLTGSLALLADAAHGLLDIGTTTFTYFAVRHSDRPADEGHHYGHGKIEAVAALCEATLLGLLALAAFVEAGRRLLGASHAAFEPSHFAFAVIGLSICVDATRWRALHVIAKETQSDALEADSLHFASDLASSIAILGGLVAAGLGVVNADAKATLLVAVLIAVAAVRLGRRVIGVLLDAAPEGVAERITAIASKTPGIIGIDGVRVRTAGGRQMGDISVCVPRTLPLDRLGEVKAALTQAIAAELPRSEFTVTTRPVAPDNETVLERVMVVAAREKTLVHHVTVQTLDDRLAIGFDMEVDAKLALSEAHARATRMEAAVRDEFGAATEIETHLEPLESGELAGTPASPAISLEITRALEQAATAGGRIADVHNVRVRQTPAGLVVHFHCVAPPQADVASVHAAVDEIERSAKKEIAGIARLIGHAEPSGAPTG